MKEIIGTFKQLQALVKSLPPPCLFRGQSNALHQLLPGIGRPHPQYTATAELEKALLNQFKLRSVPFLGSVKPISEWDWLVMAQHHGLKTRLLDWTSDWRVALYFSSLPHAEMQRVPFSIFILQGPALTDYEKLPHDPFSCSSDFYFQPPHINNRITSQAAYLSAHSNPYEPAIHKKLIQFSLYPYDHSRREVAEFLAFSRVTAAEITPGLDGICKALVDEPRIMAQIELPKPTPPDTGEWLPIPQSFIGKTAGSIRNEMLKKRSFHLILDYVSAERLIGIPCYIKNQLYGFLKYANRAQTKFKFISEDGESFFDLNHTDDLFQKLTLSKDHVAQLVPEEPVIIRKIEEPKS